MSVSYYKLCLVKFQINFFVLNAPIGQVLVSDIYVLLFSSDGRVKAVLKEKVTGVALSLMKALA